MGTVLPPLRVALVSTAPADQPGSMRAYGETLLDALQRYAPGIEPCLIELEPSASRSAWSERMHTAFLPVKARFQRWRSPDLWHVLDGSRAYVGGAFGRMPIVITVHDVIPWLQANGRFPEAPAVSAPARWLWNRNGRVMREAGGLICDSASTAADVQAAFGIPAARCEIVPLPLRPSLRMSEMPSNRSAGIVLHVGNNGFYKNRGQVLRIFARLAPELGRRLVMIGPPPTSALRRQTMDLGIEARVEWVSAPGDDVLVHWYRTASVLVFPSVYEGFGWPVLEAMAFGLPTVASDRGSLPEVVGDAGICVPLEDEDSFVASVERLLRSPDAARDFRGLGLKRADTFSTAEFAQKMHRAYSSALTRV